MGLSLGPGIGVDKAAAVEGGGGGGGGFSTAGFDVSSLLIGDLTSPEWGISTLSAYAPPVEQGDGGALINGDQSAPQYGILQTRLTIPAGTTSVKVIVRARRPVGVASSTVVVGLYTPGVGFVGGTPVVAALTDTMADYELEYTGLTPGAGYNILWNVNDVNGASTEASAVVESVRVVPTSGTGLFAPGDGSPATFYRRALVHSTAQANAEPDAWSALDDWQGVALSSTGAFWEVTTDATEFALEMLITDDTFEPDGYSGACIDIDGVRYTTVEGTGTGLQVVPFTLPAGTKRVTVRQSVQWQGAGGERHGIYLRGLLVGPCAALSIPTATSVPTALVCCDSILTGYYGDLGADGGATVDRDGRLRMFRKGMGDQSLFTIGADDTARAALVASVAGLPVGRIVVGWIYNDYKYHQWTAAAFGVAYADLLARFRAAFPSLAIYGITGTVSTDESANALGDTYADFRAQIVSACAGVSNAVAIDGPSLITTADLKSGDPVHPSVPGQPKLGRAVATAIGL